MKKITTLLCLMLTIFAFSAFAQPLCDARFTFQVTGNNVQFSAASITLPAMYQHQWSFGDGTGASSNTANPAHQYAGPGTYYVNHIVSYRSPNDSNTVVCSDSVGAMIVIAGNNTCNLNAYITYYRDSVQTNTYYFANQSSGMTPGTNVYWSFGDGATSNASNPSHTFAVSGRYQVCLYVEAESDSLCVSDTCINIEVSVPNTCNLQAGFSAVQDTTNPFRFQFSNTSAPFDGTDSIRYTFGDGTSSTDPNPSHIYVNAGTYNVCIRVKKATVPGTAPCVREFCRTIVIQQTPPACNLRAAFTYRRDSVQTNKIYFTNLSTGINNTTGNRWTFGDGTTSDAINPTHTFAATGAYTVCLRVKRDSLCFDDTCFIIQVSVPNACNLVAGFSSVQDSTNPYHFEFSNTSTPFDATDSVRYTFGDGTSSVNPNPSHTYANAGTYNVCIRVKKVTVPGTPSCVREYCRTIVIRQTPPACNLNAHIVYSQDSILTNTFYFANQSTGVNNTTSVQWTFGDGTSSNQNNPTHSYTATGTYTVCLSIQRDSTCSSDTCLIVQAQVPASNCNMVAAIDFARDSINPATVHFFNTSSQFLSTDSVHWSFGDGSFSSELNPTHAYNTTGPYSACLIIRRLTSTGPCVREVCVTINPLIDSCQLSASFSSRIDSANRRKVLFNNTSASNSATTAYWTFGDGTSANSWNAEHVYAANGRYAVCLTIISGNCTNTTCDSVLITGNTVPPVNCDSTRMEFTYRRDGYMPNKFFFFAISNRPLVSQSWTFTNRANGAVTQDSTPHPMHVFADTGNYTVCLRGTFPNGCVREYCDDIRVNSITVPQQCVLQAFPNPAHNHVAVNIQLQEPQLITASVYNVQNVLLLTSTQQGFTGNNLVDLNINSLTPGFYTIRLVYGNKVCYSRFHKF